MKKAIFLLASCTLLTIFAFNHPHKPNLVGKWTIKYRSGQAEAEFRSDGTFNAVDSKGDFDIKGKYKIEKGVFYITDSTCGTGYWGKYKQVYFNEDSLSSAVIEDSCMGRKVVCDGATLKRKKMQ